MIQIDDIHVSEFRGIRNLRLEFGSESFVVSGPNGTGKSGVVDALDFVLTGNVSRLTGPGSGGVTLARHALHVLRRDDLDSATVTATVRIPDTETTAKLTRSVKTPTSFSLEPDLPEIRQAVEQMAEHPEVMLSRREIIKFIIAESGKRSDEVQALLKLEQLGQIRSALRTAKTKATAAAQSASSAVDRKSDEVKRHLDMPELLGEEALKRVNAQRVTLGLETLSSLESDDLAVGITEPGEGGPIGKATAIRDLDALASAIETPSDLEQAANAVAESLTPAIENPLMLRELAARQLVESGLALVEDETCPLCESGWSDVEALRAHLDAKLSRSREAAACKEAIDQTSRTLEDEVVRVTELAGTVLGAAKAVGVSEAEHALDHWVVELSSFRTEIGSLEGAVRHHERLMSDPMQISGSLRDALVGLKEALESLPDTAATAKATQFLTIAQERFAALNAARASAANARRAADATDFVYTEYCAAQDEALTRLYESVESDFAEYYRKVNADESGFRAALEPAAGKLDLKVDFYSQGMFPPAAYHSEGHQDGMGVCLYLALMKQRLGPDFRLAILDDVVMSVDAGHRRRFCDLLREEFPNVQFIITTHDEIWARQMQESKLISCTGQARFLRWDVYHGPWVASKTEFWDEVDQALQANDVSEAAWRLRHNLERVLSDLAHQYRCPIPYNAAGTYGLGEFLSGIKGQYRKLLKKAATAAETWGDDEAGARVSEAQKRWKDVSLNQEEEQWALNPAVHFNEWATFSKNDFEPVIAAWKDLLETFECPECSSRLYISRHKGADDALRCVCAHVNFNLRKKRRAE